MLSIKVIEEFHSLLIKLPKAAELVSVGSYSAMGAAAEWLSEAERLAEEHQLPICADFALIRGEMQNYLPARRESGYESGRTARLMKQKNGIECLRRAKECIEQYFSGTETLISESSVLCRKLAAVAVSKGYVKGTAQAEDMGALMEMLQRDTELMPALTNVIGTVGYGNARCLLQKELRAVLPDE